MQPKDRYLCIHGHFYQPPRENPWLEAVETQDSAYPYHDWNERITAECYGPNALSRILDSQKKIRQIVSNYASISFNIGPTLLSWLELHAPDVYSLLIDSDRQSMEIRSGHGSAMAQAYSHLIMPLANSRDKLTQVRWGIADFERRYRRRPEGMWLPETAVDLETLDIMAAEGILYTILAPNQAKRVRHATKAWEDVSGGRVDPSRPYWVRLPSARKIAVFFYDSPISHAVAFEGLLNSGEAFTARLMGGFSDERIGPQLMHIATDGESYGHHHKFGDMALAYTIGEIEEKGLARLTNYGEFLEKVPPVYEAEIFENTSWSCAHGVERWRSDCGCNSGGKPGWHQKWRAPLRSALDRLRDALIKPFEEAGGLIFNDPWAARDGYISVVLERSEVSIDLFLASHAKRQLSAEERCSALMLMELARNAMLMYTSCGWFFDEISGIETVQILQYAGRAAQLARKCFNLDLEPALINDLAAAPSNVAEFGDGAAVYRKFVKFVDLPKVCAHFAISSLFEHYPSEAQIFHFGVSVEDYRHKQAGSTELVVGRCKTVSGITGRADRLEFALLYLGNLDFTCGVRGVGETAAYETMASELTDAFERGSFADIVRLVDSNFGQNRFTIANLFKDEQRSVLTTLLAETTRDFEDTNRRLYSNNHILMGFLKESQIPMPKAFMSAAEFTLNTDLKKLLGDGITGVSGRVPAILREFERWGVAPDAIGLEFAFRLRLERLMTRLSATPYEQGVLDEIEDCLAALALLPFETNLWQVQNTYFRIAGDMRASQDKDWLKRFGSLGSRLGFSLDNNGRPLVAS